MDIGIGWVLVVAGCAGDREPARESGVAEPQEDSAVVSDTATPTTSEEDPATGTWLGACRGLAAGGLVSFAVRLVLVEDAGAISGTAAYAFEIDPADGPPAFSVEGTRTDDRLELLPTGTYTTTPATSTTLPTLGFQLELDGNRLHGVVELVGYEAFTLDCSLRRQ